MKQRKKPIYIFLSANSIDGKLQHGANKFAAKYSAHLEIVKSMTYVETAVLKFNQSMWTNGRKEDALEQLRLEIPSSH